MSDDPNAPVTQAEFLAYRKRIYSHIKKVEGLVSDAFQAISDLDNRITQSVDEALEHAQRAERAVRRLKKEYDNHEHED